MALHSARFTLPSKKITQRRIHPDRQKHNGTEDQQSGYKKPRELLSYLKRSFTVIAPSIAHLKHIAFIRPNVNYARHTRELEKGAETDDELCGRALLRLV